MYKGPMCLKIENLLIFAFNGLICVRIPGGQSYSVVFTRTSCKMINNAGEEAGYYGEVGGADYGELRGAD